ncbi:Uu.00g058590.m01.CDS01 [Anthostomella pinea]|uniref:Uu.00g058590.m01.CDS01 n=1 Tax=Anthostomella pinea TaxID=933095 RepID=A0AAI8VSP8_9PEZI|nr:Uu.00g058590.m01.CDS01 [Anthostomella pinea]
MRLVTLPLLDILLGIAAGGRTKPGDADFDWSSITPSRDLAYQPCYTPGEFLCARLLVPLDWRANESSASADPDPNHHRSNRDNRTVALAIIKLPATTPSATDHSSFGGTIFTNPGGPGGSGVSLMLDRGHYLRAAVSSPSRRYEVLSWDPRGVAFTTPNADCFAGDLTARHAAEIQGHAVGRLTGPGGPTALRRQHAVAAGFGRLCEGVVGEEAGAILPFLNTASVARDMVEMVDKVGELREREREEAASKVVGLDGQQPLQKPAEKGKKTERKKVARIQYWGFSYGTVLGNTFASMFPGRVGRMILDGVVDADDYMDGLWLKNLQDTEELVTLFYTSCFAAGHDKCPLAQPGYTAWTALKSRVDSLVAALDAEPVAVSTEGNKHMIIITGQEVLAAFQRPLYTAQASFPQLAVTLAEALQGNYTLLIKNALQSQLPPLDEACSTTNSSVLATRVKRDAQQAILCSDGFPTAANLTIPELEAYVSAIAHQSRTFAPFWASIRFACSGWRARPNWRFSGPFGTPEPLLPITAAIQGAEEVDSDENEDDGRENGKEDPDETNNRPAAPLLFLTSRLDPVTPARNAFAMAAAHPRAGVVIQDSVGHCAGLEPSACTRDVIQKYLEFGTVPTTDSGSGSSESDPGVTQCKPDCEDLWGSCAGDDGLAPLGLEREEYGDWEWGLV